MGDEPARLFLRLAYALDRQARNREGARFVPWDLDPVRLPPLRTWAAIDEAHARLTRLVRQMPASFRRDWLADHLPTLRAIVRLVRGRTPSLPHQVRDLYSLVPREAKEEELDELRSQVRRILHAPSDGALLEAVAEWEDEHRVDPDAVLLTMSRYLREARHGSRRLFELPRGERARLVGVRSMSHSGYCRYTRNYRADIRINVSLPWTWPALRDMATHEAYPGHHVHQATREWEYLEGDFPREAAVSLAFCPMGPVEEGLAENGMRFIHWDRSREDRLTLALNRLRWGTEVNLAWMVHREEPRRELLRYAAHSGLVDAERAVRDVQYAETRGWASYASCYWFGTAMIRNKFEKMDGDPAFFDVLYWRPHTVRSLERAFRRL